MTITRVQTATGYSSSGTTVTVTFTNTPVSGNTIILGVNSYFHFNITNIAQAGVTWNQTPISNNDTAHLYMGLVGAGASKTITITTNVNIDSHIYHYGCSADACEYHTDALGLIIDKVANSGNAVLRNPAISGTTATTTFDNELWVAAICVWVNGASARQQSPANGFTLIDGVSHTPLTVSGSLGYLDKIVTSTNTAWTSTTSGGVWWNSGCIATLYELIIGKPYHLDTLIQNPNLTNQKSIDTIIAPTLPPPPPPAPEGGLEVESEIFCLLGGEVDRVFGINGTTDIGQVLPPSQQDYPYDIVANNDYLVISGYSGHITCYDKAFLGDASGAYQGKKWIIELPYYTYYKLLIDGNYLYALNGYNGGSIYKINFSDGSIDSIFYLGLSGQFACTGLTTDGTYIYYTRCLTGWGATTPTNLAVTKVQMSDMTFVNTYTGPANTSGGSLSYYDGHVYVGNTTNNSIIKIDVSTMSYVATVNVIEVIYKTVVINGCLFGGGFNVIWKIDLATFLSASNLAITNWTAEYPAIGFGNELLYLVTYNSYDKPNTLFRIDPDSFTIKSGLELETQGTEYVQGMIYSPSTITVYGPLSNFSSGYDPLTNTCSAYGMTQRWANQHECFYYNGRFWMSSVNWNDIADNYQFVLHSAVKGGHFFQTLVVDDPDDEHYNFWDEYGCMATCFDGKYFHYIGIYEDWISYNVTYYIKYRKGEPQSDGTIIWYAPEENICEFDGNICGWLHDVHIACDSNRNPVITICEDNNNDCKIYVYKKISSWSLLDTLVLGDNATNSSGGALVVPMSTGEIFITWFGYPYTEKRLYGYFVGGTPFTYTPPFFSNPDYYAVYSGWAISAIEIAGDIYVACNPWLNNNADGSKIDVWKITTAEVVTLEKRYNIPYNQNVHESVVFLVEGLNGDLHVIAQILDIYEYLVVDYRVSHWRAKRTSNGTWDTDLALMSYECESQYIENGQCCKRLYTGNDTLIYSTWTYPVIDTLPWGYHDGVIMRTEYIGVPPIPPLPPTDIYRCINFKIDIDVAGSVSTLNAISFDCRVEYVGEATAHYGSVLKRHSAGSKLIKFTLTRMFYDGGSNEALLIGLFRDETEFDFDTYIVDKDGIDKNLITLSFENCRIYGWKQVTGGPDDIIGEQITGYATDFTYTNPP